jgi:hypothetical protein
MKNKAGNACCIKRCPPILRKEKSYCAISTYLDLPLK